MNYLQCAVCWLSLPLFGGALAAQGSQPSLDDLAEPGRRAENTLSALLAKGKGGSTYASTNSTPPWTVPPGAYGTVVTLSPAETGVVFNGTPYGETFALLVPQNYNPLAPPPLVIAWHGYGTSQNQVFFATSLAAEANTRGWMVLAPLGIADNTFSWIPGQVALEKSLDWLTTAFPFNPTRVYGLGFSMGAGCITNFSARHQSASAIRFAALATVCGSFDNITTYNSDEAIQPLMEFLLGGEPSDANITFQYERTSTLRLLGGAALEGQSLAAAIAHVPLYLAWSIDDTLIPYVPTENQALVTYLTQLGAPPVVKTTSGLAEPHSWAALDLPDCLNFFSTKTLVDRPSSFRVLADTNSNVNGLEVTNNTPGVFRKLSFSASGPSNHLFFLDTRNVTNISLSMTDFGLDKENEWRATCQPADSTSDFVRILDINNPPPKVLRDGSPNWDWFFDPVGSLRILSPSGLHLFNVRPLGFDLTLEQDPIANECGEVWLHIASPAPGLGFTTFVADGPGLSPLSQFDPADPRYFSLNASNLTASVTGTLDANGSAHVKIALPSSAALQGNQVVFQAITQPGSAVGIPFATGYLSNPLSVSTEIVPSPVISFIAGDRLIGILDCDTETDEGRFEGLAGETITLSITTPLSSIEPRIEIFDSSDVLVKAFALKPAPKPVKKSLKLLKTDSYRLRVTGVTETTGSFEILTSAKLPKLAQSIVKKTLTQKATGTSEIQIALLPNATIETTLTFPVGKTPANPVSLSLLAPNGEAVDLSGKVTTLPGGGYKLSEVVAGPSGNYRLRVHGLNPGEKVIAATTVIQPAGGATVVLP